MKLSKEILILSLVVGLALLFLSFYIYSSSLALILIDNERFVSCGWTYIPKPISKLYTFTSWFEHGIKFKTINSCDNLISIIFPYVFWLGWIITTASLYLNFRKIIKA